LAWNIFYTFISKYIVVCVIFLFIFNNNIFRISNVSCFFVAPVISIIGWIISLLKRKWGRAVVQFFLFILWLITFFVLILARVVGNGAVEVLMDGSAMVLFSQNTFFV
jgi:hypothetical protein